MGRTTHEDATWFLGLIGEVADQVIVGEASRIDQEAGWPERSIRALQDAGVGSWLPRLRVDGGAACLRLLRLAKGWAGMSLNLDVLWHALRGDGGEAVDVVEHAHVERRMHAN